MQTLRIGTRGSALALWQAERVRGLFSARGVSAEPVIIRTSGDEGSPRPAQYVEGKGLFTKELEDALLDGRIDVAVHSLKDVGASLPDGLTLAAFPERADFRDAVVTADGRRLEDLEQSARVGTASLRRIAALRAVRPDVHPIPLRGNVPTRVGGIASGDVDAVILAMAGLDRLALGAKRQPIDPLVFMPAPGQGALGLETRTDDPGVNGVVTALDNAAVRIAVTAERAAMAELEGGCRVPLGVVCLDEGGRRILHARVYALDGSRSLSASTEVDPRDPASSGSEVARALLAAGAAELMRQQGDNSMAPAPGARTRGQE